MNLKTKKLYIYTNNIMYYYHIKLSVDDTVVGDVQKYLTDLSKKNIQLVAEGVDLENNCNTYHIILKNNNKQVGATTRKFKSDLIKNKINFNDIKIKTKLINIPLEFYSKIFLNEEEFQIKFNNIELPKNIKFLLPTNILTFEDFPYVLFNYAQKHHLKINNKELKQSIKHIFHHMARYGRINVLNGLKNIDIIVEYVNMYSTDIEN